MTVMAALCFGAGIRTDAQSGTGSGCNQPAPQPVTQVSLPGNPFEPLPTADGCWILVSMNSNMPANRGVAVLHRSAGKISLARVVPVDGGPAAATLTHDGTLMIIADNDRVAFLDVDRLIAGQKNALAGSMVDPDSQQSINVAVTADDHYLFVAEERSAIITVIDLAKARAVGFDRSAVIGHIPVGNAPVGMAFSPDGKWLYTTSQGAPANLGWPRACRPEGSPANTPANHPRGAVIVVDVARAKSDPSHAVVATVAAGCNPVRLVLSPSGDTAYVSARGDDALLVFDTKKLVGDGVNALMAKVPVGTAPVGVAVIDDGRKIVVTNSNRFASSGADHQDLNVIDAARVSSGAAAVLGLIPAGGFPRELQVTADGHTLLVTNYTSKTVEIVDLDRLPQAMKKH